MTFNVRGSAFSVQLVSKASRFASSFLNAERER
jgi:hypothetical protein